MCLYSIYKTLFRFFFYIAKLASGHKKFPALFLYRWNENFPTYKYINVYDCENLFALTLLFLEEMYIN